MAGGWFGLCGKQILCFLLLGCCDVLCGLLEIAALEFSTDELAAHFHSHETFGADAPARSCVAVAALPKGARVEIEAIAVL